MRYSMQREVILQTIRQCSDHPTADVIYQRVRQQIPNISLGTVYRNIKQLCELGLVDTMETVDKSIHYDGNLTKHRHFVCNHCGRIIDLFFDCALPPELEEMGLSVATEKCIYYGTCHDCQK